MQNAMACIRGENIRGTVKFYPQCPGVLVTAEIFGLTDGFHGFHIHSGESCGGKDFADTLGHYGTGAHPNHAGDLPPLLSCDGRAYLAVRTDRFQIPEILGRTVVIHQNRDDFTTQPTGDAGNKIACGVIIPS